MLGLYHGHNFCSMLSIVNNLFYIKEFQNLKQISIFDKKNNTITTKKTQKNPHKSPCHGPGLETGSTRTPVWSLTSRPPRQLKIFMEVKPLNCFNAICRNINIQWRNVCSTVEFLLLMTLCSCHCRTSPASGEMFVPQAQYERDIKLNITDLEKR